MAKIIKIGSNRIVADSIAMYHPIENGVRFDFIVPGNQTVNKKNGNVTNVYRSSVNAFGVKIEDVDKAFESDAVIYSIDVAPIEGKAEVAEDSSEEGIPTEAN